MRFMVFWFIGLALGNELSPRGSAQGSRQDSRQGSPRVSPKIMFSGSPSEGTPPMDHPKAFPLEPQAPISSKTKSMTGVFAKANQRAEQAERGAASARLRYHDTAKAFRTEYGAAHAKYLADTDNPAVSVEKLYGRRRNADNLLKKVGKEQKNLANAYAKASMAAEEAGARDRAERNTMKAESTAAHFHATKATYKASKDALKAKHFPAIAMRTRARGKLGASGRAEQFERAAAKAQSKSKYNEYVMHATTKSWREIRKNGGRDTDSDASESSV